MSYQLIDLVQRLENPHILVLGDLILDRYIWGDAERVSQEAPVILLRQDKQEIRLGGASNVANMLVGLEARATLAGVVGHDFDGVCVKQELARVGVSTDFLLTDHTRPTTVKERFIGRAQQRHPHQMLRVDREVRTPLDATLETQFLEQILPRIAEFDAVLISDYAKGVCTPRVLRSVIEAGKAAGVPVLVDPYPGEDYSNYRGATAVTPNRLETKRATGLEIKTPEQAFAAGAKLCEMLELEYAYVTLDSDGIAFVRADGLAEMLPTRKREVYDITGAGDMVLAMIGVGLAAGCDPMDVGRIANVAGGLEVEQIGVVTISREEILNDLLTNSRQIDGKVCHRDDLARQVAARRKVGHKVVFTNGCFDLLHIGHVTYLQQAAREGDCLIVAINSDSSVRRLNKGPDRPIFVEHDRAAMLAALEAVDYVVVFDEATPNSLLEQLRPDVLVKGGTYATHEIVGKDVVESYGGVVKPLTLVDGISTTRIVQGLRGEAPVPRPHLSLVTSDGENKTILPQPTTERKAG
ncbi:MAG: D-glycero-beta-D-manno-heptose 1-phosphate adenylyltransferase [Planctomycetota bacterium]|jgi:D-beta-D-heptose 7-phosphate kinase/D-beta-D-heptose 1-phosphate adenosyltransferase